MTVSIIIAVKTWQRNLEECIRRCRELDFPAFEVLVLPDAFPDANLEAAYGIKIIPTGNTSPAQKRDIALSHAKGEILAFIDDDAYPDKSWLKNAIKNFTEPDIAAVGGPAITPSEDSLRQISSGLVYSSPLVSGKYIYRYLPKKRMNVDDYPSCNFLLRKSIMQELGGFKTNFWPGEDTKLCLDITKGLGKKIIYDPEAIVYHHRRGLFLPHLKQIASYALHRGYFAKKFPLTSLRLPYFIPAIFLLFLIIGGMLAYFSGPLRMIYSLGIYSYLFLAFIFSINKELRTIILVFPGIILTHLTYGFYFVKGLASKKLCEE